MKGLFTHRTIQFSMNDDQFWSKFCLRFRRDAESTDFFRCVKTFLKDFSILPRFRGQKTSAPNFTANIGN